MCLGLPRIKILICDEEGWIKLSYEKMIQATKVSLKLSMKLGIM